MMTLSPAAFVMSHYFFSILGGQPFNDIDGLDLPDVIAARAEAAGFARDVMRLDHDRSDWSGWTVHVTDDQLRTLFDLPFSDVV